jgi:HPt (histidine-containing phosphotransfer) domain-containing protein
LPRAFCRVSPLAGAQLAPSRGPATPRQRAAPDDDATLRRQAHSLVSGSFALGATRFSRLCSDLEMASDDGDLAAANTLLMRAAAEFIKVYRAIQEARRALGM